MLLQLRINATLLASALANWLFFARCPAAPSTVRKVMIFQTRDLGDVVLATVVIEPLRRHFPNSKIVMVTGAWARDLVETSVPVDGLVTYHSDLAGNARGRRIGPLAWLKAVRGIARERPDVIVELRGDFGTIIAAILSGAKHRADRGSWRLRSGLHRLSGRRESDKPVAIHEADESLEIVGMLGVGVEHAHVHLAARAADARVVETLLESARAQHRPLIALHPGASLRRKTWPAARFAALANCLARHYRVQFVITGSTDERHLADLIMGLLESPVIDLCGSLTLGQLYALYGRCVLWIGNDTGPMHLAAAASIPVVALWGPTAPEKYRPYGIKSLVVTNPAIGVPPGYAAGDDYMLGIDVDHAWRLLQGFVDSQFSWVRTDRASKTSSVSEQAG